jgi:enoyl-CoA hydratase/carnithine racemase
MDFQDIRYEVADHVLTVTLNRPDRLNAWTRWMQAELVEAFDRADADDDVRAIVVTGAGRGFCAGADLEHGGATFDARERARSGGEDGTGGASDAGSASGAGDAGDAGSASDTDTVSDTDSAGDAEAGNAERAPRDGGGRFTLRVFECTKPVIAAINGPAVGVGATMTLPMDVRLASSSARMGFVFARRGIVPEAASSWFLPRVVGISRAMEWAATGRVFDAEEALAGGLVRSVHAPDELLPAAYALAAEIVENAAPVSVALSRRLMWRMLGEDHPMAAHRADSRAMFHRGQSDDAREGITAFLEKRPASFPDRVSDGLPDVMPGWEAPRY